MTDSRPVRKDVLRNRKRIVESADAVFSEQGIAATLDDVAHHAGLGVGTVYRHFPRKQDLIDAMFAERVQNVLELAENTLAVDDPWEGFVGFCTAAAERFAADRGLYDVMLSVKLGGHDVAAIRAEVLPAVSRVVARAQESGQLRKDFTAAEFPLLHLMVGSAADYLHTVDPQGWRRYLAIFLDGLRADRGDVLPVPPPDPEMITAAGLQWQPRRRTGA
ncbi:TetR/AcrR family transcriptional regulator [Amycolatopsis jejuensis]|uniref:TetR/AcrR family transcriptional regulator n=1 Tax=Amycolatopsis jejuensis TaxID=330084 RepID=UPI0005244232|nr:TetR/AcrR family transcriptional regulator [Amycolatopsis jejuensis]